MTGIVLTMPRKYTIEADLKIDREHFDYELIVFWLLRSSPSSLKFTLSLSLSPSNHLLLLPPRVCAGDSL